MKKKILPAKLIVFALIALLSTESIYASGGDPKQKISLSTNTLREATSLPSPTKLREMIRDYYMKSPFKDKINFDVYNDHSVSHQMPESESAYKRIIGDSTYAFDVTGISNTDMKGKLGMVWWKTLLIIATVCFMITVWCCIPEIDVAFIEGLFPALAGVSISLVQFSTFVLSWLASIGIVVFIVDVLPNSINGDNDIYDGIISYPNNIGAIDYTKMRQTADSTLSGKNNIKSNYINNLAPGGYSKYAVLSKDNKSIDITSICGRDLYALGSGAHQFGWQRAWLDKSIRGTDKFKTMFFSKSGDLYALTDTGALLMLSSDFINRYCPYNFNTADFICDIFTDTGMNLSNPYSPFLLHDLQKIVCIDDNWYLMQFHRDSAADVSYFKILNTENKSVYDFSETVEKENPTAYAYDSYSKTLYIGFSKGTMTATDVTNGKTSIVRNSDGNYIGCLSLWHDPDDENSRRLFMGCAKTDKPHLESPEWGYIYEDPIYKDNDPYSPIYFIPVLSGKDKIKGTPTRIIEGRKNSSGMPSIFIGSFAGGIWRLNGYQQPLQDLHAPWETQEAPVGMMALTGENKDKLYVSWFSTYPSVKADFRGGELNIFPDCYNHTDGSNWKNIMNWRAHLNGGKVHSI